MNRKGLTTHCLFETLEVRKLLSTVNVADFGAKPDDGRDDRAAILEAIRASNPGDTILFSGGEFQLSDDITLAGDRTYRGEKNASIRGRSTSKDEGQSFKIQSDDITITGLTFKDGGVFLEKPGEGMNRNIVIDGNIFEIDVRAAHHTAGITFTSGLEDSRITNNYFTTESAFGIYGYNYRNLTVANNELVNVGGGMHIDAFGDSRDLLVEQNYIRGAKGMGMEFQGTARNLKFLDNFYEKPNLSDDPNRNKSSFAFSLILDKSRDIEIKRNTVIAPERPDGKGTRVAFEVGGDNTVVEENYVDGSNHVVASNDGAGSSSVLLKNNKFMNYLQGPGGLNTGALKYEGSNDASTQLSWDTNRTRPGRRTAESSEPVKERAEEKNDKKESAKEPSSTPVRDALRKLSIAERDVVFLTDLKSVSAKNGWGPVEVNQSNGGRRAGDGSTITLNGDTYEKGLGVAINSEVVYKLDGTYSRFFSDIGVDDSVGKNGSVTFEVWVDGTKVYDSGVMTGSTSTKGVNVKLDGAKELRLVTTNAGDGDRHDLANWAGPRLLPADKAANYFAS